MRTWRQHWREYLSEALCLGLFMMSAAAFATFFQHPSSPLALRGSDWRSRVPMAVAMGLTAVLLIYSPAGRRSGAHMNPAVTLAYLRLGKIAAADAAGYVLAQFTGATVGLLAALVLLGGRPADPAVNYVATLPGAGGMLQAFAAECLISALLMGAVLAASNHDRVAPFTGLLAGLLVAAFIVLESPLSGMSMNPARSLAPNLLAGAAGSLWVYFLAPIVGMMGAADVWQRVRGVALVRCAKLHHPAGVPCIFRCAHVAASARAAGHTPFTTATAVR